MDQPKKYSAFKDMRLLGLGSLEEVLKSAVDFLTAGGSEPVVFFDHATGRQTDFFLTGSWEDVVALARQQTGEASPEQKTGPGRPKLGIVSREVTLLPRHWNWLESQPGRASGTLRKLVEEAMAQDSGERDREQAVGRILTTLCGDLPGYEEATRALYAGDREGFKERIQSWPQDIRRVLEDCLGK